MDLSSQSERTVVLTEVSNKSFSVSCKSYEFRLVAHSVLLTQVIAFADLTDDAPVIRKKLELFLRPSVKVHNHTDFKNHFDFISKEAEPMRKGSYWTNMPLKVHVKHSK